MNALIINLATIENTNTYFYDMRDGSYAVVANQYTVTIIVNSGFAQDIDIDLEKAVSMIENFDIADIIEGNNRNAEIQRLESIINGENLVHNVLTDEYVVVDKNQAAEKLAELVA
jgi:hypothetical protein